MFNGIIRYTGVIKKINKNEKDCMITISSRIKLSKHEIGSSISCSGVCLTLKKISKNLSDFYLSLETFNRTNFKKVSIGNIVNMEKSLKYGDRISGHFVQGHVDTTAIANKIKFIGKSWRISFQLSKKYKKYIVRKGSIAINGISLTISKILNNGFEVTVIPQTLKLTNLKRLKSKDLVNLEFDVLGKYINNFLK